MWRTVCILRSTSFTSLWDYALYCGRRLLCRGGSWRNNYIPKKTRRRRRARDSGPRNPVFPPTFAEHVRLRIERTEHAQDILVHSVIRKFAPHSSVDISTTRSAASATTRAARTRGAARTRPTSSTRTCRRSSARSPRS